MEGENFYLDFFNQPLYEIFRPNIVTCRENTPAKEAAEKMSRRNTSAILVKDSSRKPAGIVTDADFREKVLAAGLPVDTPVSDIMSAPVISIPADCRVFEAFLTMIKEEKRHLAVCGKSGDISGILAEKDLIAAQTRSSFLLIQSVKYAGSMPDLENIHEKLCRALLDPIQKGVNPEYITGLITTFSDAILERIMAFSLEEIGPPPCRFVFLTMGSEGRKEQTLVSDQDNAIVYEDRTSKSDEVAASKYFQALSSLVCKRLDAAGYRLCEGDNMAQNPKWCQPLATWKQYFHQWIRKAGPEDLLNSCIFFDFRGTCGDLSLSKELEAYLFDAIRGWAGFLRNMTENAMYFRPPIGPFGKLRVESHGENKDALDLKYAMLPIIDVTRVYALQNEIPLTNTLERLFRLYTVKAITSREYQDIVNAYNYVMKLRFRRQITTIMDEGREPDNYINPDNLSRLDRHMLKEIFKITDKYQQKLNMEFTGVV